MRARLALFVAALAANTCAAARGPVRLFAAGSLRGVTSELASALAASRGGKVAPTFGASGLLRDRIANGETAAAFASVRRDPP